MSALKKPYFFRYLISDFLLSVLIFLLFSKAKNVFACEDNFLLKQSQDEIVHSLLELEVVVHELKVSSPQNIELIASLERSIKERRSLLAGWGVVVDQSNGDLIDRKKTLESMRKVPVYVRDALNFAKKSRLSLNAAFARSAKQGDLNVVKAYLYASKNAELMSHYFGGQASDYNVDINQIVLDMPLLTQLILLKKNAVALLLLEEGANPELPSKTGQTPLMATIRASLWDVFDKLLSMKVNLNSKTEITATHIGDETYHSGNDTAAIYMVYSSAPIEQFKKLITSGADFTIRNIRGETPMTAAAKQKLFEHARVLHAVGAPIAGGGLTLEERLELERELGMSAVDAKEEIKARRPVESSKKNLK